MPRKLLIISVLYTLILLWLMVRPGWALERQLCCVCGRDWATSPSRMRYTLTLDKHQKPIIVCSPSCMFIHLDKYRDRKYELQNVQIIDYSTLDREEARWVYSKNGQYLIGIDGDCKRCAEPFIAAFARLAVAKEAQKNLGGELLDWDELCTQMTRAAQEQRPEQQETQRSDRRRRN